MKTEARTAECAPLRAHWPQFVPHFVAAAIIAGCSAQQGEVKSSAGLGDTSFPLFAEIATAAVPGQVVPPTSGRPRDSAHVVAIARRVLDDPKAGLSFRVATFVRVDNAFLVQLSPDPPSVGGGGVLWVESDGSVLVLRRDR